MNVSRRSLVQGMVAASGLSVWCGKGSWAFGDSQPWTDAWSRASLQGVLASYDRNYDPAEKMIGAKRGPEYNYQSNLRSMTVHPTRDALEYGLVLLEAGGEDRTKRAFAVIDRTLSLQDSNPKSKWFGLWPYYMEEPLDKMAAVDFNWADFNGSTLAIAMFRHGARIPDDLKARMMTALEHCCESIKRRNVSVYYTNIIAQGSFVVLAAAQLGVGGGWLEFGRDRLHRWAVAVDQSGSFAEYNSPAYTSFLLEIMTRIANYVHDPMARVLADKLERRAWEHFSAHWHAPTMQLAGPMSRCYNDDIGLPLWLQKSLNNRVQFQSLAEIPEKGGNLAAAILDYHCPDDLVERFVELKSSHTHREMFISADILLDTLSPWPKDAPIEPVVGTTMLTPKLALGSANRSDFWVQRRPLLAYWGGRAKPAQWMQLRVIKDDYDFSSALFHSVQQAGDVLGVVGFRSDGGDKHPLIDRIKDGAFAMQSMKVEWHFAEWKNGWKLLVDGKPSEASGKVAPKARISVDTGVCRIGCQVRWTAFDVAGWERFEPVMEWTEDGGERVLRLTLYQSAEKKTMHWSNAGAAGCAFTLRMSDGVESLAEFDKRLAATAFSMETDADYITARAGKPELGVRVRHTVGTYAVMEESFHGTIDAKILPAPRLNEAKIAS